MTKIIVTLILSLIAMQGIIFSGIGFSPFAEIRENVAGA